MSNFYFGLTDRVYSPMFGHGIVISYVGHDQSETGFDYIIVRFIEGAKEVAFLANGRFYHHKDTEEFDLVADRTGPITFAGMRMLDFVIGCGAGFVLARIAEFWL